MIVTSLDFLNISVGTFFALLVIFLIVMILRILRTLDEVNEVLVEAKESAKNARELSDSARAVAAKVEDMVMGINIGRTVSKAAGLFGGIMKGKSNKKKRSK